tara:strand:- start:310 stop:1425 length:1116 start_codon:yes stop_codon:yes gene_type:complete
MKIITIVSLIILLLFFAKNLFSVVAEENYTVIKKLEDIEIRQYKNSIYASYIPKNEKERNNSFKKVASFIFGDNTSNKKISMTSPVVIKIHNDYEMAFLMPEQYSLENLPRPSNKEINIYTEPGVLKACIEYSGYTNNSVENKKINELKKILLKYSYNHENDFEVLVYNSPFDFLNRRNEITVTINMETKNQEKTSSIKNIYFGGGCFWCTEAVFEQVKGVEIVASGYSGGKIKNPSYKEVSKGLTRHAEVCKITYDENIIKLNELVEIFFYYHDPTTLNRQGNDYGSHYRSIILYNNNDEEKIINTVKNKINKEKYDGKIVTEIKEFANFYYAEELHQNYFNENSSQPYCEIVISPKLSKVRSELNKYFR